MNKANLENRSIFCHDNLEVLQGINSDCIDLIYLDPPFNKNKIFTAPTGTSAEGASFKDIFREEDVKDEWLETIKEDNTQIYILLTAVKNLDSKHRKYNYCYLCYMAIRLIEMKRILKDTGSLYLHCDHTMSHYLKLLLDYIFGEKNFRNEIVWGYRTQGVSKKWWPRKHDVIFMYVKSKSHFYFPLMERQFYTKTFRHTKKDKQGRFFVDTYLRDVWDHDETKPTISQSPERTGFPTQKPVALLERILKASSVEGDLVLDPFCGCATTCVASEKLNRQWVGIDISIKAYDLVQERLKKEAYPTLFDEKPLHFSTTPPKRTDKGDSDIPKKWIYIISNKMYTDEYKVGIASDWQSRLSSYQTSDPNRGYKLEYKLLTPHYREIEKYIHEKFTNRHEWVRETLPNIKRAITIYDKKLIGE